MLGVMFNVNTKINLNYVQSQQSEKQENNAQQFIFPSKLVLLAENDIKCTHYPSLQCFYLSSNTTSSAGTTAQEIKILLKNVLGKFLANIKCGSLLRTCICLNT